MAREAPANDDTEPRMTVGTGHASSVVTATFSSDSRLILTGSQDGTARLWETATGRELRRFGVDGDAANAVTAATLSPDCKWVLIARRNEPASLWDAATGRQLRRFQSAQGFLKNAAVFSPDGQRVLSANWFDGVVYLWDAATGNELGRFVGAPGSVDSLTFSPDGRSILTVHDDGIVRLWDVASGRELRRLEGAFERDRNDRSAGFSSDGKLILTYNGRSGSTRLWDTSTGRQLPGPRQWASRSSNFVILSPDDRWVLTSWGTDVLLWDVGADHELRRLTGHTGEANAAAISPDGRFILTADPLVTRLWDATSGSELRRLESAMGSIVASAVFSLDGQRILSAAEDGTVVLWDIATGRELRRFKGHNPAMKAGSRSFDRGRILSATAVTTATFSPRGDWIMTTGLDGTARLWDIATGQELRRFNSHGETGIGAKFREAIPIPVTSATFSPDGEWVLVVGYSESLILWEAATGRELRRFIGHRASVNSAVFSPDGRYVLTTADDRTARLWEAATGRELRRFNVDLGPLSSATFSPDGQRVLTVGNGKLATLWDVATGRELHQLLSDTDFGLFSHDGRFVLTERNGKWILWDAVTGREVHRLNSSVESVQSAAFSPDSRWILIGNRAGTMTLWNTTTGHEIQRFAGHTGAVNSITCAPNGRWVLTTSQDHLVRLWDIHTGAELVRMMTLSDGKWVVATPKGRFDSNDLEQIRGVHWIMPDDPFRLLPLEIFMRDYYEPRLLPRVLAGETLRDVPRLDQLNRVQPTVEIKELRMEDIQAGLVTISVEVANSRMEVVRNGESVEIQSGAFDLRLFRDGQLVAQFPEPLEVTTGSEQTREQELTQWRQHNKIKLDPKTWKRTVTFHGIRVPRRAGLKDVEFSAYAFNLDRVKSATARSRLDVWKPLMPRQGRAYVVAIGVNGFERDSMSRLSYAANDAKSVSEELRTRLAVVKDPVSGQLLFGATNVVPITLVTEFGIGNEAGRLITNLATKDRIKAVIEKLAGKPVDPARLTGIANVDRLMPAQPEDLVILSFSTHGDTASNGQFYLMPHDLGNSANKTDILQRAISSEELSVWLRTLDAGELVMIVDACHSAATVESQEFKPGPMGSRGLGQLAFDKGMRILAASQRDQTALETEKTRQGLLTYALVHEGLISSAADFRPKDASIRLSEWLSYGAERVPELYREYREGKLKARAATPLDEPEGRFIAMQQPALFDFARGRDIPLIGGLGLK